MKQNQVVALEKGIKTRTYEEVSTLYKAIQKAELFNGLSKTYEPKNEDGETYPPESKRVQMKIEDVLRRLSQVRIEAFNITATKDVGNCSAKGSVVVDGTTLIADVPATFLLYLEKELDEIRKFFSELPTLSDDEVWMKDENSGEFRTDPIKTHRMKKEQRPLVLAQATKEHPAQTQLITEDVLAGYWITIKQSAAMPKPRKQELLERIEKLRDAVKVAREQANDTEVSRVSVGEQVFSYLLK